MTGFLPELRERGKLDELNRIFADSPSAPFDLYLINGHRDGQAHQAAIEFIEESHINKTIAQSGDPGLASN